MSFYATVSGYLSYRTHDHLAATIHRLTRGQWLNHVEQWILNGDPDRIRCEGTIDHDRNLLVIPFGLYRNLARITTELFTGATEGQLVISSTDGCFDAWIEEAVPAAAEIPPGEGGEVSEIQCIDLIEFAEENEFGVKAVSDPGYQSWQHDVLTAFHNEHDPDVIGMLDSSNTQGF